MNISVRTNHLIFLKQNKIVTIVSDYRRIAFQRRMLFLILLLLCVFNYVENTAVF